MLASYRGPQVWDRLQARVVQLIDLNWVQPLLVQSMVASGVVLGKGASWISSASRTLHLPLCQVCWVYGVLPVPHAAYCTCGTLWGHADCGPAASAQSQVLSQNLFCCVQDRDALHLAAGGAHSGTPPMAVTESDFVSSLLQNSYKIQQPGSGDMRHGTEGWRCLETSFAVSPLSCRTCNHVQCCATMLTISEPMQNTGALGPSLRHFMDADMLWDHSAGATAHYRGLRGRLCAAHNPSFARCGFPRPAAPQPFCSREVLPCGCCASHCVCEAYTG